MANAATAGVLAGIGGGVAIQAINGKPVPRRIDTDTAVHRPTYWRNWVGYGSADVDEDAYKSINLAEQQTSYPMELPEGQWLPPDSWSGVNPAVGTICNHTGRASQWRLQQLSAPEQTGVFAQRVNRANRAPMPPKQRSMFTT